LLFHYAREHFLEGLNFVYRLSANIVFTDKGGQFAAYRKLPFQKWDYFFDLSAGFSWRMQIELQAPPPEPRWPAGVELRPFDKASHDRLVWQADAQAFSDHFGYTPGTFENWQLRVSGRDKDGTLWFIAWDGDQVAGYSLCRYRGGIGFVGALGVVRPWRRRGLGMALLQRSFGEFYRRGMPTIGLGVDSQNSTGATRLYERAGMHIASEFVLYEKELRLGRNLADGH